MLDEPTAALTETDARRLLGLLRGLRGRGVSSIYISHRLEEVFTIADRITVLRDGRTVATGPSGSWTPDRVIAAMVGREIRDLYPRPESSPGKTVLAVENWRVADPDNPGHLRPRRRVVRGARGRSARDRGTDGLRTDGPRQLSLRHRALRRLGDSRRRRAREPQAVSRSRRGDRRGPRPRGRRPPARGARLQRFGPGEPDAAGARPVPPRGAPGRRGARARVAGAGGGALDPDPLAPLARGHAVRRDAAEGRARQVAPDAAARRCSWTSRRAASTSDRRRRSTRSPGGSRGRGSRSCSSPPTCRSCSLSRTACSCCRRGAGPPCSPAPSRRPRRSCRPRPPDGADEDGGDPLARADARRRARRHRDRLPRDDARDVRQPAQPGSPGAADVGDVAPRRRHGDGHRDGRDRPFRRGDGGTPRRRRGDRVRRSGMAARARVPRRPRPRRASRPPPGEPRGVAARPLLHRDARRDARVRRDAPGDHRRRLDLAGTTVPVRRADLSSPGGGMGARRTDRGAPRRRGDACERSDTVETAGTRRRGGRLHRGR